MMDKEGRVLRAEATIYFSARAHGRLKGTVKQTATNFTAKIMVLLKLQTDMQLSYFQSHPVALI